MSSDNRFRGVFTALVTPLDADGGIEWEALENHVNEQIAGGVDGLVPVGTTGESPTLATDEHIRVIETVVKAARGRVPVIAGTGSNSTVEALHLTREADRAGADAFVQVAPYYNKPSQEGLYQHFKMIAESTDKPLVLYSIPGRCGVEIAVETVARLSADCPNVCYIKEAGGKTERVTGLRAACPQVTVFSGDDGLIPQFIEAGAMGVVSVASNFAPGIIKSLTEACLAGDTALAGDLFSKWQPLLPELVFLDGNPVTIKEVMFQAGRLATPTVRLPLVRTSQANQARIRELLQSLNMLPNE